MLPVAVVIFATAFLASLFAFQKTIFIAIRKSLFDVPDSARKIHEVKTPNLGGVAIFSAFVFSMSVLANFYDANDMPGVVVAAAILIFFVGVTDDLSAISPITKLLGQLMAAILVCSFTDLRIDHAYGLFGISQLPHYIGFSLTVLFIVFTINAYNLIDGINWLAGSLGVIATITYSISFYRANDQVYFMASVALTACLLAFLVYNKTPAKIFMGDSGSLFLGFCISVFSLRILNNGIVPDEKIFIDPLLTVVATLALPATDTLRVFLIRVFKGQSPLRADNNHLHHLFLRKQFTHIQSSLCLAAASVLSIAVVASISSNFELAAITALALPGVLAWVMLRMRSVKTERSQTPNGKLVFIHSTPKPESHPDRSPAAGNVRAKLYSTRPSSINSNKPVQKEVVIPE